jgi:CDP-diacylglycerol pyrophosphatase
MKKLRPMGLDKCWTVGAMALLVPATSSSAANLPRDTLWRVVQTCSLDDRTTGLPFPCLEVDLTGGAERGFAVLRAPFQQRHIVLMPTSRIVGIEAAKLRRAGAPNYFQAAWSARNFVQDEVKRPLGWIDIGLAVNSRLTRSQDQLHIHVGCVRQDVKRSFAHQLSQVPTTSWQPSAFSYGGQSYWARRIESRSLDGVNVFRLADEIATLRLHPARSVLAVIGVAGAGGQDGFLLLAGQSAPNRDGAQSTSEDLLDYSCGKRE